MTYQKGKRIALVHTNDPHTRLRPGDKGTVRKWNPDTGQLSVNWDAGSALIMLLNEGDQVRPLDDGGDLLRSYAAGPRIWDAAAIVPEVYALADKSLIEPTGDNGAAYHLTEAGRRQLDGDTDEREDARTDQDAVYGDVDGPDRNGAYDGFQVVSDAEGGL